MTNTDNQISVQAHFNQMIPAEQVVTRNLSVKEIKESSIPHYFKETLIARYGEYKIKELDANFAGEKLKSIINLTIFESGYKVESISEIIILIIRDIFSDFSFMTIGDIALACRKGVRGQLGEFMGLSVKTFYTWFKSYNEEIITEANKQLFRLEKPQQEISEEEKAKIHKDWLLKHIEDFEQYKTSFACKTYDYGNIFYEYLVTNSIVVLSTEEKAAIKQQARLNLIQNYSSERARNHNELRDFKTIVTNLINEEKSEEQRIVSEAKRIAISVMFNKLIQNESDLGSLIAKVENWN